MTDQITGPRVGNRVKSDIVISAVILAISVGVLVWSLAYPSEMTLILPRLAAGLGVLCTLWMIVSRSIQLARGTVGAPQTDAADDVLAELGEDADEVDANDPEYILSHTSRRDWLVALGFIAGFFVALYLFGLFISAAALSLSYLIAVGRKKWWFAVIYTVVLIVALYVLMRVVTYIPSPAGIVLVGG